MFWIFNKNFELFKTMLELTKIYFMKCDLSCLCIFAEFCHSCFFFLFFCLPKTHKTIKCLHWFWLWTQTKRVLSDMNSKWTFLINDKHVAIMFVLNKKNIDEIFSLKWQFSFTCLQFYSNHTFYTIFTPHGNISFLYSTPFLFVINQILFLKWPIHKFRTCL